MSLTREDYAAGAGVVFGIAAVGSMAVGHHAAVAGHVVQAEFGWMFAGAFTVGAGWMIREAKRLDLFPAISLALIGYFAVLATGVQLLDVFRDIRSEQLPCPPKPAPVMMCPEGHEAMCVTKPVLMEKVEAP